MIEKVLKCIIKLTHYKKDKELFERSKKNVKVCK